MTNGGQIQASPPATPAAGSPIVRRPTRHTTTAATTERAMGTSRRVSQLLPAIQNTGTVSSDFLRSAVSLAPEERRRLSTHGVVDHQPDHSLVAVGDTECRTMNPDSECDTGRAEEYEQNLPPHPHGPLTVPTGDLLHRRSNERAVSIGLARARGAGWHARSLGTLGAANKQRRTAVLRVAVTELRSARPTRGPPGAAPWRSSA